MNRLQAVVHYSARRTFKPGIHLNLMGGGVRGGANFRYSRKTGSSKSPIARERMRIFRCGLQHRLLHVFLNKNM